jgi:hypothetical protein
MFLFTQRIAAALCLALSTQAMAAGKLRVACLNCYSSTSLYPIYAQQLAPDVEIEWILVQTHEFYPEQEASMVAFGPSAERIRVNPDNPAEWNALVEALREKGALVLGGMCEGAYHASSLAHALGQPENDLDKREQRRRKDAQAKAVGKWKIPTHVVRDVDAALEFIDSFTQTEVVLKPNAGAAGIGFESIPKSERTRLVERLSSRLIDRVSVFDEQDEVIAQPNIVGQQYHVQTETVNGVTKITGLWRYHMLEDGQRLALLVDRPVSLFSDIAKELGPIVSEINESLGVRVGSAHIEMRREASTGRWYLVENNVRTAGSGIPALESQIWGISQLELTLLRILDPARLQREFDSFPRRKKRDGFLFILPSAEEGMLTQSGIDLLQSLPGYFPVADHYAAKPHRATATTNLKTAAGVFHYAGTNEQVRQAIGGAMAALRNETLIDFDSGCAGRMARMGFYDQLDKVAAGIDLSFGESGF